MACALRIFLLYIAIVAIGVLLEVLVISILSKNKRIKARLDAMTWLKYLVLMIFPWFAVVMVFRQLGLIVFNVYFAFSFLGAFFEWLIGFSYHQIVGERLWTYHKYSINGYTSWLSLPLWGLAGVLFWLFALVFT